MSTPSHAPFHTSPAQRVELARQQFFEEGKLPSGLVDGAVMQSWARCQRSHPDPTHHIEFDYVSASRSHLALQRNRQLLDAWASELNQLEAIFATTTCSAVLTDATGVVIAVTKAPRSHEHIMPMAHRVGVNLSEDAVGTSAPGLVAKTEKPVTVLGGEHYYTGIRPMHCAAAPIHNTLGQLAGVLDISSEGKPFNFDAMAVVLLYASSIENRLLVSQSKEHLVVQIQVLPSLIDTPMVGLVGIEGNGALSWMNGVGARLLGLTAAPRSTAHTEAESVFGMPFDHLLALPKEYSVPIRLANGLTVWVCASMHSSDGRRGLFGAASISPIEETTPISVAQLPNDGKEVFDDSRLQQCGDSFAAELPETRVTLRDSDMDLILRTLKECNGNVSRVARLLGVSRGLIYRRIREAAKA